ncbi:hypothetical protein Anae109_2542 [Anaeromyxobacter sp. Fw109-5]|nr:hypothetical protein Anae109_2542 [Anaeromyxobacter sp. Fw109-5]
MLLDGAADGLAEHRREIAVRDLVREQRGERLEVLLAGRVDGDPLRPAALAHRAGLRPRLRARRVEWGGNRGRRPTSSRPRHGERLLRLGRSGMDCRQRQRRGARG